MRRYSALVIAALVVWLSLPAVSQGYNALHIYAASVSGPDIGLQENSVIQYHKLAWTISGAPATCTVKLEQSADNISWSDLITNQTCTANGNSAVINASNTWVRINVTALTGGSSPVLTTTYTGYVQNPSGGGISTGPGVSGVLNCIAASGSGTAYTCTTNPSFTPAAGNVVLFVADVISGAAPTLAVNGSTALPITTINLTALTVGALAVGSACLMYDDATHWQMLCINPGSPNAIGSTNPSTLTGTTYDVRNTLSFGAGAGHLLCSATAPTITSGGGTSPTVTSNGTCSFAINVGTGTITNPIVLALPAASAGWHVQCEDVTSVRSATLFMTSQTASSTNSATITQLTNAAATTTPWTASDILECSAWAN